MGMSATNDQFKDHLRIIFAITTKDIVEALRNKNTIAIMLSALFLIIMYRVLPSLESGDSPPNVLLYDAGESQLVTVLENSQVIELYTYKTEKDMKHYLANGQVPELGLVVPVDFDQSLSRGQPLELRGYALHWVDRSDILELKRLVETEASRLMGTSIVIQLDDERIYPWEDTGGLGVLTGLGIGFVVLMTGMILPPHLMLEEKESHTVEVLLVSPASAAHIVVAKALTGLFYCFIAIVVVFGMNHNLIANWTLAWMTVFCGSIFAVSLGLLLGTVLENRKQMILWAWVLLIPLMVPMMLSLMDELIPEAWLGIFKLVPTTVLFQLYRASFSNRFVTASFLPQLAYVFAWAIFVIIVVIWLVRRMDR
jgi:hypothetical protein